MGFFRTFARACVLWGKENALDLLSVVVIPGTAGLAAKTVGRPASRWATTTFWAAKTVDGGVIGGVVPPQAGAKFAVPKGLPKPGERALAIENEPHLADGFDGKISAGYGKGLKTLLADERVAVKIGTKTFIRRMNYHYHEADKAGPHYDIVVEGVPSGTRQFEINIPRGTYKGRYAFVETAKGTLVVPMTDKGLVLPKPDYSLKPVDFLNQLAGQAEDWIIEQKLDGSLANVLIDDGRAVFRSHRPSGETYYDRLPQLESLQNTSRIFLLRQLMPAPRFYKTVLQTELVHPDGHGRMGGILNAMPEKAHEIQRLRGPADVYCWDIHWFNGKDVRSWPEWRRRELLERVVTEVRLYNKCWHVVPRMSSGDTPRAFYDRIISQPLPWGEGVVIKPAHAPVGALWYKVKDTNDVDLPIVSFIAGTGKYGESLGALRVRNPETGAEGLVGSFRISDEQRQWIWEHRADLAGTVARVETLEVTRRGVPRAGVFVGFHSDKGEPAGLMMYAESLSGGSPEETRRAMYRLKAAAGWRRTS